MECTSGQAFWWFQVKQIKTLGKTTCQQRLKAVDHSFFSTLSVFCIIKRVLTTLLCNIYLYSCFYAAFACKLSHIVPLSAVLGWNATTNNNNHHLANLLFRRPLQSDVIFGSEFLLQGKRHAPQHHLLTSSHPRNQFHTPEPNSSVGSIYKSRVRICGKAIH